MTTKDPDKRPPTCLVRVPGTPDNTWCQKPEGHDGPHEGRPLAPPPTPRPPPPITRILELDCGSGWCLAFDVADGPANVHGVKEPIYSWALTSPGRPSIPLPLAHAQVLVACLTMSRPRGGS